jgi:hypothetical protein
MVQFTASQAVEAALNVLQWLQPVGLSISRITKLVPRLNLFVLLGFSFGGTGAFGTNRNSSKPDLLYQFSDKSQSLTLEKCR